DDPITTSQSPAGPYSLGETLVTLTVVDSHSATGMCSAMVTVVDGTPPSITCPANITTNAAPSQSSRVVTFAPSVLDNCDPNPTVSCTPASGSAFPLGTTTVNCEAVDTSSNTGRCSFTVTVLSYSTTNQVTNTNDSGPGSLR